MYAKAALMNPIRFLCVQKYAKLPVSNLTIRGEKRTSSPPSLLLGAALHGARVLARCKTPSSCKALAAAAWERDAAAEGTLRSPLPTLPGCSGFRGTAGQSQQRNRPEEHDHLLCIFRRSFSVLL